MTFFTIWRSSKNWMSRRRYIIQHRIFGRASTNRNKALNSEISQVRTLGLPQMDQHYQDCRQRIPLLLNSRQQHKKITGNIELLKRGTDVDTRLNKMRILISQARKREIMWSRIKHYSLPFTLIMLVIIAMLCQFLLMHYYYY